MNYVLPEVHVSQIVNWQQDPSCPPTPAVVLAVGTRAVSLAIIRPLMRNLDLRDGVRHKTDPQWEKSGNKDAGIWDYTEVDKKLQRALAAIQELVPQEVS